MDKKTDNEMHEKETIALSGLSSASNSGMWARLFTCMLAAISAHLPAFLRWRLGGLIVRVSAMPYFTPNCVFKVRRGGCVWRLNPSDYICGHLFWYGDLDRCDFAIISGNVTKGDRILDIGSNFGYYSISLAKRLGGDCRIDAFEPFPETFAKLQANIQLNSLGCIHPHRIALGDSECVMSMLPVGGNTGAAYLSHRIVDSGAISVNVNTLDQFVREQGIARLDFVKIDVEGFEYAVLEGGKCTLATLHPPLMIEVCPENLVRQNKTVEMLIAKLKELSLIHI